MRSSERSPAQQNVRIVGQTRRKKCGSDTWAFVKVVKKLAENNLPVDETVFWRVEITPRSRQSVRAVTLSLPTNYIPTQYTDAYCSQLFRSTFPHAPPSPLYHLYLVDACFLGEDPYRRLVASGQCIVQAKRLLEP